MFWKFFKRKYGNQKDTNFINSTSVGESGLEEAKSKQAPENMTAFVPNDEDKPTKIRLVTDEYHLEGLGKLSDDTYFLMSSQLHRDWHAETTTDYICKFLFNSNGDLIDHKIVKIGIRGKYKDADGVKEYVKLAPAKGTYEDADISIKPFSVLFDGIEFGFILRTPEDEEEIWAVEFMPGNTMAFFEPWDSGVYDT